jgi:hypothetical protein
MQVDMPSAISASEVAAVHSAPVDSDFVHVQHAWASLASSMSQHVAEEATAEASISDDTLPQRSSAASRRTHDWMVRGAANRTPEREKERGVEAIGKTGETKGFKEGKCPKT